MADINNCVFTGRIGADVVLKTTPSGTSVASINLAVDRPKAKGADKAETDWIDLVAWGQEAEFASRYLTKGRKITATCAARTRLWTDKNGSKHKSVEFMVIDIVADSRPAQSYGGSVQAQPAAVPQQTTATTAQATETYTIDPDDELPF